MDGLPVVGGLQLGSTVSGLVKTVVGVVARDLPGGASLSDPSAAAAAAASNVAYSAASIPMEIISPDGRVFEEVGRVPSKGAGVAGNIIGYLSNGLPVYGALSTASQALSGTPAGGPASTVAGTATGAASMVGGTASGAASMVGNTASGVASTVGGTVAGALANTPVGGVASQVGQTAAGAVGQVGQAVSGVASTVGQTATGAASAALGAAQGILPLGAVGGLTNTVGGVLGSLPIVGGATHGGFGILSTPDDPSSVAPSASSVTAPNPTDIGSATGNSGASSADEPDDGDDSGDDDDYESGDDDGDDNDAKDGTDDGTPIVSSSVSSAMATPTASLPSA